MIESVSAQYAYPPDGTVDTRTFDKILEPVWKIYSFVKYIATAIAVIVLAIAGIMYMTSGSNMARREDAKHTISFVVLGLVVIWAAPFIVQLLVA